MRYAGVIVDLTTQTVDRCFTYAIPNDMDISPGDMVRVPFGKRIIDGFVLEITAETNVDSDRIKCILKKSCDQSVLLPELIELASFMKQRYSCTTADALRAMIPPQMRMGRVKEKSERYAGLLMPAEEALNACKKAPLQSVMIRELADGEKAVSELNKRYSGADAALKSLEKKAIIHFAQKRLRRAPDISDEGHGALDPELTADQIRVSDELADSLDTGGRFLLYGVTGSGKTEVYIRLIREVLKRGKGAVILVPEIALTPQTVGWFHARFGDLSAVIHSRLSAGERFDEWQRIRSGEAKVVIGARSAVFAPVENLGAIIIDEEHEGAYISEKHPRYDAREIAQERMRLNRGVLLLGSATPSISSYMRTLPKVRPENRIKLLELDKRVLGRPLPECTCVDMRQELEKGNKGIFSNALVTALRECMNSGKQAMLFINRRGHSTFVSCRACGYVVKCDSCDVTMTYHQAGEMLKCHYCGAVKAPPESCPKCASRFIKYFGAGTQRIEQDAKKLLPEKRILRMDMDTTAARDSHAIILEAFRKGDADILVGTQMIAKGLDFPKVTLVGVIAADTTLNLPDYRSAERTFQLLTQVAGRAGRADTPGKVIIQTYTPEHYAIQCALRQDYRAFFHMEANYRRRSLYPPYTMLARIVYSSAKADLGAKALENASERLRKILAEKDLMKYVLSINEGEAPIKRLRGEDRYQLLVKMYAAGDTPSILNEMENLTKEKPDFVFAELEVDPINMI